MNKNELAKLYRACTKSLDQLRLESREALNLLGLLAQFPDSMETRTAYQFQRDRESRALADYLKKSRNLFAMIEAADDAEDRLRAEQLSS